MQNARYKMLRVLEDRKDVLVGDGPNRTLLMDFSPMIDHELS